MHQVCYFISFVAVSKQYYSTVYVGKAYSNQSVSTIYRTLNYVFSHDCFPIFEPIL
jgi:hypothetical protein